MASEWSFSCTHCGARCSCAERLVKDYPGEHVTLWCDTCQRLFDVRMPPRGPSTTSPVRSLDDVSCVLTPCHGAAREEEPDDDAGERVSLSLRWSGFRDLC